MLDLVIYSIGAVILLGVLMIGIIGVFGLFYLFLRKIVLRYRVLMQIIEIDNLLSSQEKQTLNDIINKHIKGHI